MSGRIRLNGAAALAATIYMKSDGRHWSFFPKCRGAGLNLITLAIMPQRLPIAQMETWLRMFERTGHTKLIHRNIPNHLKHIRALPPAPTKQEESKL